MYIALNRIGRFNSIFEDHFSMKKGNEVYFLAAIGCFSKHPTACVYEKANGPNILNLLDIYIENHGVPRSIGLDQPKCLYGNQVKTFCKKRAIGLV